MPEQKLALGVDYGTNSVRALIVDVSNGEEVGTGVWNYATGEDGVWLDPRDPNLARQHPKDYADGFFGAVSFALQDAVTDAASIVGIGVDTTGSTPIPVDQQGVPLALTPEWHGDLSALAWLWKDHTAHAEAAEITELANRRGEPYLAKCGGTYSSEWYWSKLLHCARVAPDVFEAAHTWVEAQDMIPAWLCRLPEADAIPRGICAAGHKAMYHDDWGGMPSESFLSELHPALGALRRRLDFKAKAVGEPVGGLDAETASRCGLSPGTPVSIGAFDAHLGAVGSGVKPGTLVKIMGTSTCDIMVGIEAGQSAVGDLFDWCANRLPLSLLRERGQGGEGSENHILLTREAERLRPGESGLVALDWNNGNRTVLVDPLLSGLIVGQSLHTTLAEVYRALIEATAFGARRIIEQIERFGVGINEVVVCGGIAEKSPFTMQIYADVLGRPMKLSRSSQTCALGAAICGAVVGGAHADVLSGITAMTGVKDTVYRPEPSAQAVYDRLYGLYLDLHDAFGGVEQRPLGDLMKELIRIRSGART